MAFYVAPAYILLGDMAFYVRRGDPKCDFSDRAHLQHALLQVNASRGLWDEPAPARRMSP